MRARDVEAPPGAGAEYGLSRGVVGIGAVSNRARDRFSWHPDGVFVWTRDTDGRYWLGRIAGPARDDDSAAARAVGIACVRPAEWLERPFGDDEVPAGVAATFARGG